ncbi:MAG: class I tRNA ligase family protein, partial [Patescibacteria group bacterium]
GLLIKDSAKMSKSKGNVVNPDEYIKNYGADVLRMYLMFIGPFEQGGDFRDSGIKGITRFLDRIWKISNDKFLISKQIPNSKIQKTLHKTIKKVTEDIENLSYNTAISTLMILLNEMELAGSVSKEDLEMFIKLLAPFAPHMGEEIWRKVLGNKESVHTSIWPKYDPKLIRENESDVVVQINGKMRAVLKLPTGASQAEVEKVAKREENVSKHLNIKIKRIIFVKNKFINFVV